jgi:hypothetical protein
MVITITQVRNAASLQSDNLRMDVEISHPQYGWIPYTLDPDDTDTTIDNDAVMALIGSSFTAYVAPTADEVSAELAKEVRSQRDFLLNELDEILSNPLRWSSMSSGEQTAWSTYRQALLDVPQQSGFPAEVTWPQKPDL